MSALYNSLPSIVSEKLQARIKDAQDYLHRPVDVASLVVFRIAFGAIMLFEVYRFFDHDWIRRFYIIREFYFKYYGFEWVQPWLGDGMYIHFVVVGILALCIALGLFYRITTVLFFVGFTYWFLLDQTRYLNHLYMVALIAFLMCFIPAHVNVSLDARRKPSLRSDQVSMWHLWLLRFQVGLVYFYAGIAKLNGDWLQGEPVRMWLQKRSDYPLIGPLFETEVATWFFSYGGLMFDLFIVPAILWKRTRYWALAAAMFFHATNKMMFDIGIFPMMMLAATTILLPADWPRRIPLFFSALATPVRGDAVLPKHSKLILAGLAVWVLFQVLMPFRHVLYPGNVHWTEEGHRFSWHMKLRDKGGTARFIATSPSRDTTWEINQREYLSSAQRTRMSRRPDMILQFAHHVGADLKRQGFEDIEIRVDTQTILNHRPPQPLIDPQVDLLKVERNLMHATWILPLKE